MASTADIKNGVVLNIDGQLWSVVEFQHVKPGKGGAFVRTKLKNVLTGKVVDKTFNAGAKIEIARLAGVNDELEHVARRLNKRLVTLAEERAAATGGAG